MRKMSKVNFNISVDANAVVQHGAVLANAMVSRGAFEANVQVYWFTNWKTGFQVVTQRGAVQRGAIVGAQSGAVQRGAVVGMQV